MKYRKKPIVVEAVLWDGCNHREMYNFLESKNSNDNMNSFGNNFYIDYNWVVGGLIIKTLEGEHIAKIGDYIIKGINGDFYPCKPDIFENMYEKVEEGDE